MIKNNKVIGEDDDLNVDVKDKYNKNTIFFILITVLIVIVSFISILITIKYINHSNNVNITIINKYIESLELKTAYGYKHPIQKIDINISEYAKNYIVNPKNKECGQSSQLILINEEENLELISCEFINKIENDSIAKNISIYVPEKNNSEIFSNNFNNYSDYLFLIGFNDGEESLLDYDWILTDRQGRRRNYEFCNKYKNLCKYTLNYNSSEFEQFK